MKKQWFFVFQYDKNGKGNLELREDSLIPMSIPSRTGSIRAIRDPITGKVIGGELVKPLSPGIWRILDEPVDTTEPGCTWTDGLGWKVRLYGEDRTWTHYLIHPDGGKMDGNGTEGCIGLQGDYLDLKARISQILKIQTEIFVYVNTEVPKPEPEPKEEACSLSQDKPTVQSSAFAKVLLRVVRWLLSLPWWPKP